MSKTQKDRKRQAGFTATGGSGKKFCFVKKGTQGPPQSSSTRHWRVTPSQNKPSGNFQFRKAQQQSYKPSAPPANNNNNSATKDRRCYNCGQPGHYINECPKPRQNKQSESSGFRQENQGKKPMVQVKQGKLNYTSMVNTPEGASVLTGIFSMRGFSVKVLFDFGATHSFINEKILGKLRLRSCRMNRPFLITTPGGRVTTRNLVMRVPLELDSKIVPTNLLALSLEGICDHRHGWVDPTSSCFGHCHENGRNPFPYQWSHHLVFAQNTGHKPLFLCCHNRPTRKHSSSVSIQMSFPMTCLVCHHTETSNLS
jgi:hypothetical protein